MRVVILGKGGHARMLKELTLSGHPVVLTDDNSIITKDDLVVIGVGAIEKRRALFHEFKAQIIKVVANGVWLPTSAKLGVGVQFCLAVQISSDVQIGNNVLLNTGAQIDHDCTIGDHCVIAPGAILCGNVTLGEACFVGAGAIIVEGVELPDETRVPAGTLVVGSTDFRKPVRMVQRHGAIAAAFGA